MRAHWGLGLTLFGCALIPACQGEAEPEDDTESVDDGGASSSSSSSSGSVPRDAAPPPADDAESEPDAPPIDYLPRPSEFSLAHELMWVDKERSLVAENGSCNYVPDDLVYVNDFGVLGGASTFRVRQAMQPDLAALIAAATTATSEVITILSAYRSFAYQVDVHDRSRNECSSAYPGHSEHQLGTTIDLEVAGNDTFACTTGFGATEAYAWLMLHAHEYGFTISYPHCNVANYREETWHLRWVGTAVATQIHNVRAEAIAIDPEVGTSVSLADWFRCYEDQLPLVFGQIRAADGSTEIDAQGRFVSACQPASGPRYGRATDDCSVYCAGNPLCQPYDQAAVCALFSPIAPLP